MMLRLSKGCDSLDGQSCAGESCAGAGGGFCVMYHTREGQAPPVFWRPWCQERDGNKVSGLNAHTVDSHCAD